jgi:hypothetical protein
MELLSLGVNGVVLMALGFLMMRVERLLRKPDVRVQACQSTPCRSEACRAEPCKAAPCEASLFAKSVEQSMDMQVRRIEALAEAGAKQREAARRERKSVEAESKLRPGREALRQRLQARGN